MQRRVCGTPPISSSIFEGSMNHGCVAANRRTRPSRYFNVNGLTSTPRADGSNRVQSWTITPPGYSAIWPSTSHILRISYCIHNSVLRGTARHVLPRSVFAIGNETVCIAETSRSRGQASATFVEPNSFIVSAVDWRSPPRTNMDRRRHCITWRSTQEHRANSCGDLLSSPQCRYLARQQVQVG
jgi:hypothetical protein